MSYSNDAQGSRSRRKIQRQNSYDKMSKNISDVSQAGGAGIAVLGATGTGLYLKAKNTTTKTVSNKGLTPPTKQSVKKVINRSIVNQATDARNLTKPSATRYLDMAKNESKLLNSSKVSVRLQRNPRAKEVINSKSQKYQAAHRLVSTKENKARINIVKKAKTMGKIMSGIKNITVPGIIATIMKPKKVGDATLKGNERQFKRDYGST